MIPLVFVGPGEEACIRRISGSPEIKKHLENLGFIPGHRIMVVSPVGKNLIVKVKESRVALNEELAGRIMVSMNQEGE